MHAARIDILQRRIPNWSVVLICVLWFPHAFTLGASTAGLSVLIAAAVLACGALVWLTGSLGAGDAKLVAALALWAGPEHTLAMFAVVALSGALIALGLLTVRCWSALLPAWTPAGRGDSATLDRVAEPSPGKGQRSVPCGVAIAAGGLWVAFRLLAG